MTDLATFERAAYGRAHARLNTSSRDAAHCVDELTLLAAQMFAAT